MIKTSVWLETAKEGQEGQDNEQYLIFIVQILVISIDIISTYIIKYVIQYIIINNVNILLVLTK